MKLIICSLLLVSILFTMTSCQQGESASMQSQEPQPISQKNIEYEFRVMTDDNAPIGCEIGTDRERQMDVLEMLAELETLKGFIFPADSGVTLRFSFSNKPEDVYVRFISEGHWQEQYPYENQRIAVPEKPGIYNIFVDIRWSEEISETAFFSIAIQERDNRSDSNFERLTGQVIPLTDLPSFSINERVVRAGTQEELEAWYQTIANATDDTIAKITICDMASSASELTLEQANAIMRILKNAKLKTFSQLGNPATGGTLHISAYDLANEMAWQVSFDDYWFTVDRGIDGDVWIFDGRGTDLGDLKNFTEAGLVEEPEPTPTETGDGKKMSFPVCRFMLRRKNIRLHRRRQ